MRSTSDTLRIIKAIMVILPRRKRQRRCVACKLKIMLSRTFSPRQKKETFVADLAAREITARTVFVTSNNYFTIRDHFGSPLRSAKDPHADIMNYAISPPRRRSLNVRNRGSATPAARNGTNEWQKRTINLSPRLRRVHAFKVISLARRARVYTIAERTRNRFSRAATTAI